jgi:hypothetical protein
MDSSPSPSPPRKQHRWLCVADDCRICAKISRLLRTYPNEQVLHMLMEDLIRATICNERLTAKLHKILQD